MELSRFWMGLLLIGVLLCGLWFPAAAQVYEQEMPADWQEKDVLRITAFAVGEGDALLLQCGGESMMVDGGSEPYRAYLRDSVRARGITHFKYLLNTHYHEDHISGLYWLMRYGFTAGAYLTPYTEYAEKIYIRHANTVAQARRMNIPVQQVFSGDELLLGEAVITLYRQEDGETTNAKSMVARVQFGDAVLLLTADIIGKTQTWMARSLPEGVLDADIVKAPHHGITAMTTEFWKAVSPEAVLLTNIRSKAHASIVQAENRGVPYFLSGEGDVVMETDGDDWYVYQLPKDDP